MSILRHWLIMAVLSFSGCIIFMLPFLQEVYYIPLAQALDLTNTQVGSLMSVFGITAMMSYFPGAAGYRYFFLTTAAFCAVGLVATLFIYFKIVRKRSGETQA